jgi:RHS repeat-associated protein
VTYDALGQVSSVKDPRNLATTFTASGLGDDKGSTSPDTGSTSRTFDASGNLLTSTDARGKLTTYTHDGLNRLTSVAYASGTATTFEYDGGPNGVGHLTRLTDESGSTAYSYDVKGQLTSKAQTIGTRSFVVAYAWGSSGLSIGKPVAITYPSGARVNMAYGADGRVQAFSLNPVNTNGVGTNTALTRPVLSSLRYSALGDMSAWTWGSGTPYARGYDAFGRLKTYTLGNAAATGTATGVVRTLVYDDAGRITGFTHASAGGVAQPTLDQSFGYDGLGRLTSANAGGAAYAYAYDAAGNRTRTTVNGTAYDTTVNAANNRLLSTQGAPGQRSFSYDAAGNLLTDGGKTFGYSDRGRLSAAAVAAGALQFKYDGLGRRASKTGAAVANGTGAALYVHDEAGRLLGEYDANGIPLYEVVYAGGMPVALITQSRSGSGASLNVQTALFNVYADHLGAPRVVTRATDDAIVWRWDRAEPFGASMPDQNPGGLGPFVFNLRFPGQVFDPESGYFHNLNRDYDPSLGRYLQSDPIGLAGGVNPYAYAAANPVSMIDPDGLTIYRSGSTYSDIPFAGADWMSAQTAGDYITGWQAYDPGRVGDDFGGCAQSSGDGWWGMGAPDFGGGADASPGIDWGDIGKEVAWSLVCPECKLFKAMSPVLGVVRRAAKGLPPLRQAYVEAVSELKPMADSLRAAGADTEAIARALHAERRAIGEQFKALTPADKLAEIYQRNLQKYGDKLGPTVDWLRAQGKSWDQVIESATRTGGKDLGF